MDCATFESLLPLAIADAGNTGDRAAIGEHASGCMPCRRTLQEWEEAQRVLESTLGTPKTDPRQLQALGDSVYSERFGSAVDLKTPAATTSPLATTPWAAVPTSAWPLLIGAAGGILIGYVVWGGGQSNQLAQQYLQQVWMAQMMGGGGAPWMSRGGPPGGFGAGGWLSMMPGISASLGNVVRGLFAICLVVWLCRTRLWDLIFPANLPKAIHMVRLLAIPLVLVGLARTGLSVFLGPAATFGIVGPGPSGDFELLAAVYSLFDVVWTCGFWLVMMILLFTVIESFSIRFLGLQDSGAGKPRWNG